MAPEPVTAPPQPTGPRSRTSTRTLTLATDPYLLDHCLLQAPEGSPDADRFPLMPLTATVAMLMDAAAELVPELTVIGVRGVRALRPVVVDPQLELVIEA